MRLINIILIVGLIFILVSFLFVYPSFTDTSPRTYTTNAIKATLDDKERITQQLLNNETIDTQNSRRVNINKKVFFDVSFNQRGSIVFQRNDGEFIMIYYPILTRSSSKKNMVNWQCAAFPSRDVHLNCRYFLKPDSHIIDGKTDETK